MSQVLISWKEECDAIHLEMDRLLAAGRMGTAEERQVRQIQFMALIERRNVAAQNCLKSPGGTPRFAVKRRKLPEPLKTIAQVDPVIEPDSGPDIAKVDAYEEPAEAALATDHSQAPSGAAPAPDQGPQAPPANPMFNAANFLKVLGLK